MKTVAPDYYNEFFCIADKCKHSCCIGWEIDIDSETLHIYNNTNGNFGARLRNSINCESDTASFKLSENDRCPFLNEHGLCDIITELGEDALCNICSDHPRFRNFLSDRTEIGLGLCCEAASRLILSRRKPVALVTLEDDGKEEYTDAFESKLLKQRDILFGILQDRTLRLNERVEKALTAAGTSLPEKSLNEWAKIFSGLEQLDESWQSYLMLLTSTEIANQKSELDTAYEQLLVYFIYRHTASAEDDRDFSARVALAVLGYKIIQAMCEKSGGDFDTLCELARMYSSEIEYSEENTAALIEMLKG